MKAFIQYLKSDSLNVNHILDCQQMPWQWQSETHTGRRRTSRENYRGIVSNRVLGGILLRLLVHDD